MAEVELKIQSMGAEDLDATLVQSFSRAEPNPVAAALSLATDEITHLRAECLACAEQLAADAPVDDVIARLRGACVRQMFTHAGIAPA